MTGGACDDAADEEMDTIAVGDSPPEGSSSIEPAGAHGVTSGGCVDATDDGWDILAAVNPPSEDAPSAPCAASDDGSGAKNGSCDATTNEAILVVVAIEEGGCATISLCDATANETICAVAAIEGASEDPPSAP